LKTPLAVLVAARYFRTKRRNAGNASSLLSVAGIAIGVMTLTVVLAVMNGFQLGFIDSIVEISSYHLQCRADLGGTAADTPPALDSGLAMRIRAVTGVTAVVPFVERQALVEGVFQRPRACSVRAVPPELLSLDPVQGRMLDLREGSFSLSDQRSLVIGSELAAALGARVGDALSLTSYATGAGGRPSPRRDEFRVSGVFHTGYYDFDAGLVFMSLKAADALYGAGTPLPRTWGIKIGNRFDDARPLRTVSSLLAGTGYKAESWRTYNRSFFDALFMEKLMMMVLIGIIFIVVGFNVYHSLRRSVFERMEEIAVLKAVGIPPRRVQAIFILEGLFIGLAGGTAGLIAGLVLAVNVSGVFALVEGAVNWVLRLQSILRAPFVSGESAGTFAIFSPTYFYLTQVPSHVYLREAFLVSFFAVMACTGAAWAATRAISRFRPSEVLRYE
jgi:lipoprotein-releasing system permease protein